MQITGTNLIVGTLTFSLRDPYEHSYREIAIIDGQTITLADHFRFDTNITSNVTAGNITLLIETTDRAVQSDLGGSAAGSNTQIQYNNAGAFGASPDLTWDNSTKTFSTTGRIFNAVSVGTGTAGIEVDISGDTVVSNDQIIGAFFTSQFGGTSTQTSGAQARGVAVQVDNLAVGQGDTSLFGITNNVFVRDLSSSVTGLDMLVQSTSASTISSATGLISSLLLGGITNNATGVSIGITAGGSGTYTTVTSISSSISGGGTIPTAYGIFLENSATCTVQWGIYQSTAADRNYFAGDFTGFGTSTQNGSERVRITGGTRLEGSFQLYGNGSQSAIQDASGNNRLVLNTGSGNTVEIYDGGPNLRVAIEQGSSIRFYDTTTTVAFSIDDTNLNVAKHLKPTVDNTYDLGTGTGPFRFKDGQFGGTLSSDILSASFAFLTNTSSGTLLTGGGSVLGGTMVTFTTTTNTVYPFAVKSVAGTPIFIAEVGGIDVAFWGTSGNLTLGGAVNGAEMLHVVGTTIFEGTTYNTFDHVVDDATKGLVLKDTQGTPHYWRVTVNNSGVLQTTDLGTTPP